MCVATPNFQAVSISVEIYDLAGCVGGDFSRKLLMVLLELPDIAKAKIRWCDHRAGAALHSMRNDGVFFHPHPTYFPASTPSCRSSSRPSSTARRLSADVIRCGARPAARLAAKSSSSAW